MGAENEIRVEMTIANQCTGERNHLFPFLVKNSSQSRSRLFLAIYFLPQKIVYLIQIHIIFAVLSVLKVYNFVKVYTFLQEIRCLKILKVEFLRFSDF